MAVYIHEGLLDKINNKRVKMPEATFKKVSSEVSSDTKEFINDTTKILKDFCKKQKSKYNCDDVDLKFYKSAVTDISTSSSYKVSASAVAIDYYAKDGLDHTGIKSSSISELKSKLEKYLKDNYSIEYDYFSDNDESGLLSINLIKTIPNKEIKNYL